MIIDHRLISHPGQKNKHYNTFGTFFEIIVIDVANFFCLDYREFLSRFRSRTSATSGMGAVPNPTNGFYSGLSSEVNAIEMEDLSKGRSNNDATSTKNTMISSCNTPTCLTSLTDLTKIGLDGTISAEAVRDRVQANMQDQTFDLKVCIF